MVLKKVESGPQRCDLLHVLAEPLPGRSEEDVVRHLDEAGAVDVTILAPGFISAVVPADKVDHVGQVASVTEKQPNQVLPRCSHSG
jgi:hypothetical protein